ncbi:hypothetical protein P775_05185 [Puniceibacterium antarcticum]|uniref:HTH araC/xylS-type domain-containing protein n=2 Tax=Puniceibacterium antarcticum TaxID=1206336 RepID=A0A2G8RIH3_9RHOB|nr:hypothetical protein P775_05185 [Puniceibacterium antarcticum]
MIVILLDNRYMSVTADRTALPQKCACGYVPGGVEFWGKLERPGPLRHLDIHLSQQRLSEIVAPDMPLKRPLFLTGAGTLAGLAEVLTQEAVNPQRPQHHTEHLAEALILEFFHLARTATDPSQAHFPKLATYIQQNMDQRISIESLATLSGMSRSGFGRKFRKFLGVSPHQWVMEIKIEHAKTLMLRDTPFVEVADATGFADQAHFNRMFKAVAGQTPSFWIKRHRLAEVGENIQDIAT